jgi:probable phosphoglycerate mutase
MAILITRHGESEANTGRIISNRNLPHPLTKRGLSQALRLAESLNKREVRKVFTSPILRAKETGTIIAESLGVPLIISPALREFDCGEMEGRGDEAAWAAHHAVTQAWDEDRDYEASIPPDGESFNDMKARFLPFLGEIITENASRSDDVLLVSHGGMLHQMLPLVLTNVDRAFIQQHPLGNCALVVTLTQNSDLVCSEWAGIKVI